MRIGFLTGGQLGNLTQTLKWAEENGFEAIEVSSEPGSPLIDPAKVNNADYVAEVKRALKESNVIVSCLTWCVNHIDLNVQARRARNEHLKKIIEMANKLEIPVVATWVGMIPGGVDANIKAFAEVFPSLVDYAEKHDVKIAIENCMANIAYRPDIWDEMFKIIQSKYFGLEFDPSHLVFQFIDYIAVLKKFGGRVYHTHCKDTEVIKDRLSYVGYTGSGWWRFRIPGLGDIDWRRFITTLMEVGYDYVLSIEHEDPFFEGVEGFRKGLLIGKKTLSRYLP
jgi:sugar phosphate isomerase/epimerase